MGENFQTLRRLWDLFFDSLVGAAPDGAPPVASKTRRIRDVESWDGSPSRWPDTEAYCADCLLDVNAAAGRDTKAASHCKLPVRGPDDGADTYVRQAVHAAAGGHGLSQVRRPDDVSPAAWATAVARAANRLRAIYRELEEEAPATIVALAGPRALSLPALGDQVWLALNPAPAGTEAPAEWAYPLDLFVEEGQLFALYGQGGRLYRVEIVVEQDRVHLGPRVQVSEAAPSPAQRHFFIQRQRDGRVRWTMIAATSVLNRVGEIDSCALFDSFVAEARRSGDYPLLDFYHLGSADPPVWQFGRADYLARDGVCYIASGLFDDHPLAGAVIRAVQRQPQRWGASIEFRALGEPERFATVPRGQSNIPPVDIKIPVYRQGQNTRISVVLERDAAGHFTTLGINKEIRHMRADILEKLTELYGNGEEALAFLEHFNQNVDRVNRIVAEEGLIFRHRPEGAMPTADDAGEEPAPNEPEDEQDIVEQPHDTLPGSTPLPAAGPAVEPELVLDESAVRAITDDLLATDTFRALQDAIQGLVRDNQALRALLDAQNVEMAAVKTRATSLANRVKALERDEGEKQREWLDDLPARRTTQVTFRPRHQHERSEEDDPAQMDESLADVAARTLAALPDW